MKLNILNLGDIILNTATTMLTTKRVENVPVVMNSTHEQKIKLIVR